MKIGKVLFFIFGLILAFISFITLSSYHYVSHDIDKDYD